MSTESEGMAIQPTTTGPSAATGTEATSPSKPPATAYAGDDTKKGYSSLNAMEAEHPEVVKQLKMSMAMEMVNQAKHDEEARKRRAKQNK